jgi:hypothetical protein
MPWFRDKRVILKLMQRNELIDKSSGAGDLYDAEYGEVYFFNDEQYLAVAIWEALVYNCGSQAGKFDCRRGTKRRC